MKPDIRESYKRVLERISVWESKQRRAHNALVKLKKKQTYYERLIRKAESAARNERRHRQKDPMITIVPATK